MPLAILKSGTVKMCIYITQSQIIIYNHSTEKYLPPALLPTDRHLHNKQISSQLSVYPFSYWGRRIIFKRHLLGAILSFPVFLAYN